MNLSHSEGQAQALRGLVELAVIELMGKLTNTPYWNCLGADPTPTRRSSSSCRTGSTRWPPSRGEIVAYFQNQLRRRGFYDGPVDGEFNPAIDEAIANYRAALGLSREAVIDEALFGACLNADHSKITRPAAARALPRRPRSPRRRAAGSGTRQRRPLDADAGHLEATDALCQGRVDPPGVAPADAYVYCYLQDEDASSPASSRTASPRTHWSLPAGRSRLPGTQRFQLAMNRKGAKETIACLATPQRRAGSTAANLGRASTSSRCRCPRSTRSAPLSPRPRGTLAQETLHVQAK